MVDWGQQLAHVVSKYNLEKGKENFKFMNDFHWDFDSKQFCWIWSLNIVLC